MREESGRLTAHLSPAAAWAFSVGTSIGWGSLVVTSSTYLAGGGPAGSTLGMFLGMVIMLVVGHNYAYLMNCYPDAGGAYAYCREAFGADHGFLTAWFLALTYLAILWANATSLPLFARYFLGDIFEIGRLYSLFGYEIYLGEALLSVSAIALVALLCTRFRAGIARLMTLLVIFFAAGILICFVASVCGHGLTYEPAFAPDRNAFGQVIRIAVISPWAFIGFESISHGTEEFRFRQSGIRRVLLGSVVATTALYIAVTLLSASAYPPGFTSWWDYILNLGSLEGLSGLPAFYAADHYLGRAGVGLLMLSLLALILTSLIGNITALSRLFFALSRDHVLPERFSRVNRSGAPGQAILLVACLSLVIPFIGRTAIGWIVDVTTFGATLVYGYVSAAARKTAAFRNDRTEIRTGLAGLVVMICFGLYLLLPNLFLEGSMAAESYFLFVIWSVLGFAMFRTVLKRDNRQRFGKSIIVWVALLSLILFVSLVWMSQSIMSATEEGVRYVEGFYGQGGLGPAEMGVVVDRLAEVRRISARSIVVVAALFVLSLWILINNYRLMSRQAEHTARQLGVVRNLASIDPLTGVKSKLAYAEREKEIDEQIRSREAGAFAVAVCDVNGL
ncbi:MAG: APC family permease [Mogibacterium sp.]|nr:APC family permease [Mogibacterium sp.]